MEVLKMPDNVKKFIDSFSEFIITGHKEPDGDCIGSMFAMESFLREKLNKKTVLLSAGPFKRTEIKKYESQTVSTIPEWCSPKKTGLIIVDCTNRERTGDIADFLKDYRTMIIDHHASNDSNEEAMFVNPSSPAAVLLIQQIIEEMGYTPAAEQAKLLFFGLATDSGFFRHLDASSAPVFEAAARLVFYGANPKEAFNAMNGGKSANSRILISRILSRLHFYYDNQLAVSYETIEDTEKYGLEGRDSDMLYQLIQSIEGVEAIVIIRQETETNCTVGFRSRDKVDVRLIAESFGGGGHKQAAGLSVEGTIKELEPEIVKRFENSFF